MNKIKENDLLENKDLREQMIEKLEVLDKVKELLLLHNTELMTTKMVADYFEVVPETIKTVYNRNKEELSKFGVKTLKGTEFQEFKREFQNETLFGRANSMTVYTKQSVLILGMLLTDSNVAERLREELVNQQEVITDKQKIHSITKEEELMLNILRAKDGMEQTLAIAELNNYKNRYIAELNVNINRMKPKEEAYDTFIDASGYQKVGDAGKTLGIGQNKLYKFLRDNKVLMNSNVPYQTYVDREWFVVKQYTLTNGIYPKNVTQTYVTPKGIDGIRKLLHKKQSI